LGAWACDPPIIIINSPGGGVELSGTITLDLAVTSETEVQGVDIYLDGKLLKSLTEEPYKYQWDTAQTANGSHELYVKARSLDREDGVSETISFTVKNQKQAQDAG
jgi:hypothetical protein